MTPGKDKDTNIDRTSTRKERVSVKPSYNESKSWYVGPIEQHYLSTSPTFHPLQLAAAVFGRIISLYVHRLDLSIVEFFGFLLIFLRAIVLLSHACLL
jgi:hypothetical protein